MAGGEKIRRKIVGTEPLPMSSRSVSIEAEKTKLGIDALVFELAAEMGRRKTMESIRHEIDSSIVEFLERSGR